MRVTIPITPAQVDAARAYVIGFVTGSTITRDDSEICASILASILSRATPSKKSAIQNPKSKIKK